MSLVMEKPKEESKRSECRSDVIKSYNNCKSYKSDKLLELLRMSELYEEEEEEAAKKKVEVLEELKRVVKGLQCDRDFNCEELKPNPIIYKIEAFMHFSYLKSLFVNLLNFIPSSLHIPLLSDGFHILRYG